MNIAALAIKRPVFVVMIVVSILVLGYIGYSSMGVDMLPEIEYPTISVVTTYPGASAEEIENLVTKPLEDALAVVGGLDTLSSSSRENVSEVTARFGLGTDVKYAETKVRDAVNKAKWRMPDGADEPSVMRFSGAEWIPVLALSLRGDADLAALREMVDDLIKPELEKVQGVGRVQLWGGRERAVMITVKKAALNARYISFGQIVEAVNKENINIPSGEIRETRGVIDIRVTGRFESLSEIENIPIKTFTGRTVRLKDLASVKFALKEETRRTRVNGENAVVFGIYKQSGENSVAIAKELKEKVSQVSKNLAGGFKLEIFRDPTHHIEVSIHGLQEDIILGALCAMAVVWLFLGSFRSTMITAVALPNSLLGAFFFINNSGFTINMMVLLALSLSIGLLIDDSIIVRENIFRYIEKGMKPKEAALKGTNEVALAVIATTTSIMAVFIPISFLDGIVGQFFKQFGMTVAFALAISLLDAFTTAPMLSAYWYKKNEKQGSGPLYRFHQKWEKFFNELKDAYTGILEWGLNHKARVVSAMVILLAGSLLSVKFIGTNFMPDSDYGDFEIMVEARPGASLEEVDEKLRIIEAYAATVEDFDRYYTAAGQEGSNKGSIFIALKKGGRKSSRASIETYEKVNELVGRDAIVTRMDSGAGQVLSGEGGSFPIVISITGEDIRVLESLAVDIKRVIGGVPGVADTDTSYRPGRPEVVVRLDRVKAAKLGISTYDTGILLNTMINGREISRYKKGEKEYGIILELDPADKSSAEQLKDIMLTTPEGAKVPLSAIARFERGAGPIEIKRENKKRIVRVTGNLKEGFALGDVINSIEEHLKRDVRIPAGYEYKFKGEATQMTETIKQMSKAMALALLFMYMILASLYNSFTQPLILMLSVPLAVIGAFLALLITGQQLDIMAMIGILMVLGLVAKNGILLIDFANQKRAEGLSPREALMYAGPIRLRPILMTTFAMIAGMLPLALGFGESVIRAKSMPIAVIGGLLTSTFLTLVLIPVVYEWAEGKKKK